MATAATERAQAHVLQSQVWAGTGGVMGPGDGAPSGHVEPPVDVFLPRYRGVEVPSGATVQAAGGSGPARRERADRSLAGRVRGPRLSRPAHRPSARLRSRRLLRRRERRLPRQRLALRAAVPGCHRGPAVGRTSRRRAASPRLAGYAGGGAARLRVRGLPAHLPGGGDGHHPQPGLPGLADAGSGFRAGFSGRAEAGHQARRRRHPAVARGNRAGRAGQHGQPRLRAGGPHPGVRDGTGPGPRRLGPPLRRDPQRPRHDSSGTRQRTPPWRPATPGTT